MKFFQGPCCIILFSFINYNANAADNSRSDSLNIRDFNIHLNVTDFTGKTISGSCAITFKSKLDNITELDLDLLKMNVDSVKQNNQQLAFTYSDSITLRITLSEIMYEGDSSQVIVYYHGKPKGDPSGWGGWYWSGNYAYNLGVGFASDPHPYGRVWFPCFDNFVERSTFHFFITTPSDKMATCNGEMISAIDNGDGTKTWYWEIQQPIPSYLASVAVAPYTPTYSQYISITGDTIPIMMAALPADTTKMKNSFVHLKDALSIFENHFGKFQWNKVGYTLVPFNSGSMEHATNIASPVFASNGTTAYEDIFFHELSHHWFGDLVTCRTEEDMWLNEGWAVYCEKIFFENEYGKQKYKDAVAANHENAVHYAHTLLRDSQYFALNAVPHNYSYTSEGTVYSKGADVAHTLRSYMGDSLFFHCITNYLADKAFSDVSSEDMRDYLSGCSGIDLSDFFDDWVLNPGWAAFTIDSVESVPGQNAGSYDVRIFIRQRLDHAPHYYSNVPLEISFYDSSLNVLKQVLMISGACNSYSITLPFSPVFTGLDLDGKISDAVTADLKTIKVNGTASFVNGKMTLNVSSVTDSALVRIEHVYAAPDPPENSLPDLHISQERFWKVDGIFPSGFDASASINYSGRNDLSGFLDNHLITNAEDSLVVLYRPSVTADWTIDTGAVPNFLGSHTDKKGLFQISHLRRGEYTFGIFQHNKIDSLLPLGMDTCLLLSSPIICYGGKYVLNVFPNPSEDSFTVQFNNSPGENFLEIFNLYGERIYQKKFSGEQQIVSASNWERGIYLVKVSDPKHKTIVTQKIVIN